MDKRVEHGRETRSALLAIATELFTDRGYEATSIDLILQRASVSRGSLYHHFDSKEALFEAVLDPVEADVAKAGLTATAGLTDPVAALRAGASFLKLALDPTVRQIVLFDSPTAVGWERWREIAELHAFGLLKAAVVAISEQQSLPSPPEMIAHVLLASLIEMALLVARAEEPRRALADARATLDLLIDRVLQPPPAR